MKAKISDTLGAILNKDFHAARVFSKHGFDFWFGESMTLSDACDEANVSTKMLLDELSQIRNPLEKGLPDFSGMEIDALTTFIEKFYHRFTEDSAMFIRMNIGRLVRIHGAR